MPLGWMPKPETIVLAPGQDWVFSRKNPAGFIATGTTAWVDWSNGTRWDGVILNDTVSWKVESADADLIPHGHPFKIRISYPDGANRSDYIWFFGQSRRTPPS